MKISVLLLVPIFFFFFYVKGQNTSSFQTETQVIELAKQNIEKYRKAFFNVQFMDAKEEELKDLEVEVEQISHDFLFGCIIFDLVNRGRKPANEEAFKDAFKNLFNFAVFPFYWSGYEPEQGVTNREKIEEVARWCNENGITCKGHPLVWTHEAGTPRWLAEYSTSASKKLLQKRVQDIVSGFRGEIEIFDVINEVIHTVNWDVAMEENRKGADNRYTGRNLMSEQTGFMDSCFQWAHAANPDAHLILNEFNIVANEADRLRFYDVVKSLLEKNTPVNGLGIQAHEPNQGRYYYSPRQIWSTFEKYNEFGLPLHLTELIQVANGDSIKGGYKSGVWTEQTQAEFAEMIYTLAFGYPAVVSINWWGFSDAKIWQPKGGLVDENLEPKPVYHTLDRLINHDWKTTLTGLKPGKNGRVTFRGFKGDYKVKILKNGKVIQELPLNFSDGENILHVNIHI